jgi:hypothetical protein
MYVKVRLKSKTGRRTGRRKFERRCELKFELKPAESEAGMPAQFCFWCYVLQRSFPIRQLLHVGKTDLMQFISSTVVLMAACVRKHHL